jgi:hypothetical protein
MKSNELINFKLNRRPEAKYSIDKGNPKKSKSGFVMERITDRIDIVYSLYYVEKCNEVCDSEK